MEERRPLTREQARIQAWAKKRGIEPPPGLQPDSKGVLHGGCLKFGLGGRASPEDMAEDGAVLARMRKLGYDVKSSKDEMSWEWTISMEQYQAGLDKQHADAIRNTNPRPAESAIEDQDGYWDDTSMYLTQEPVTVDKLLEKQSI